MATQRVKTTIRKRVRKTGGDSGYDKCNMCNGTGRHKSPKKKGKKKS